MLHYDATHTAPNNTYLSPCPPKMSLDILLPEGGVHSLWPKVISHLRYFVDSALCIMSSLILRLLSFMFNLPH